LSTITASSLASRSPFKQLFFFPGCGTLQEPCRSETEDIENVFIEDRGNIGLATAKLFAHGGADVLITGWHQDALNIAVAKIGPKATGFQRDVSNLSDLDRLVAAVKAKGVSLDIVFANAGAGTLVPIAEVTEEHYHEIFDQ